MFFNSVALSWCILFIIYLVLWQTYQLLYLGSIENFSPNYTIKNILLQIMYMIMYYYFTTKLSSYVHIFFFHNEEIQFRDQSDKKLSQVYIFFLSEHLQYSTKVTRNYLKFTYFFLPNIYNFLPKWHEIILSLHIFFFLTFTIFYHLTRNYLKFTYFFLSNIYNSLPKWREIIFSLYIFLNEHLQFSTKVARNYLKFTYFFLSNIYNFLPKWREIILSLHIFFFLTFTIFYQSDAKLS